MYVYIYILLYIYMYMLRSIEDPERANRRAKNTSARTSGASFPCLGRGELSRYSTQSVERHDS